ncbi:MAG: hypothetical protein V7785_12480 [Bermanella sp.]
MDRLNRREIEQILGIYAPFKVKDVSLDNEKEVLTVQIEERNLKYRSPFRSINKKTTGEVVSWQHTKTGRFSTIIEIEPSVNTFSKNRLLNPPAFLGSKDGGYTYHLQQTVLQASSKKLDSESISTLLGIDRPLVNQIIAESNVQQENQQIQNLLPMESDPIWRAILTHEISFKTNFSALKFLISRLEFACVNKKDEPGVIQDSVATLRQFFIKNKAHLKSEYAQIGVNVESEPKKAQAPQAKKRVSLTAEHPVWDSILSGDIDLLSKSTALNLYIMQLKSLYRKDGNSTEDKIKIAKELLFYMKKNIAKLKPELVSISRIVAQMGSTNAEETMPTENHPIWRNLVSGDVIINSKQMAYKLLLVKAKSNEDPQVAAELIRQYFTRNIRMLDNELSQIKQQIAIAS